MSENLDSAAAACQRKPRLRRWEASRYLREQHGIELQPTTLAKIACLGSDGPPFFKCGRVPLYPIDELDRWAVARLGPLRTNTSGGRA